jgi:hypothetical protein
MIGNCMRAFALSTAFAIISSASPAIAGGFDGNWNMVAVTTSGHCGNIPIGLGISRGQISSTSGKFAFHRIQLAGRISASGQARINAVAGPRVAHGTGRFNRSRGSGTWAGTGALRSMLGRLERHSLLTPANPASSLSLVIAGLDPAIR